MEKGRFKEWKITVFNIWTTDNTKAMTKMKERMESFQLN